MNWATTSTIPSISGGYWIWDISRRPEESIHNESNSLPKRSDRIINQLLIKSGLKRVDDNRKRGLWSASNRRLKQPVIGKMWHGTWFTPGASHGTPRLMKMAADGWSGIGLTGRRRGMACRRLRSGRGCRCRRSPSADDCRRNSARNLQHSINEHWVRFDYNFDWNRHRTNPPIKRHDQIVGSLASGWKCRADPAPWRPQVRFRNSVSRIRPELIELWSGSIQSDRKWRRGK